MRKLIRVAASEKVGKLSGQDKVIIGMSVVVLGLMFWSGM